VGITYYQRYPIDKYKDYGMLALKQDKLLEEIELLPIDLKTKLIDKILASITPINASIDALWLEEGNKRREDIEKGDISLIDGDEVFKKISQRLKQ